MVHEGPIYHSNPSPNRRLSFGIGTLSTKPGKNFVQTSLMDAPTRYYIKPPYGGYTVKVSRDLDSPWKSLVIKLLQVDA